VRLKEEKGNKRRRGESTADDADEEDEEQGRKVRESHFTCLFLHSSALICVICG
jgi:hypothetical protein